MKVSYAIHSNSWDGVTHEMTGTRQSIIRKIRKEMRQLHHNPDTSDLMAIIDGGRCVYRLSYKQLLGHPIN